MSKEHKKPKTAGYKGKRYRCANCRKRAPRKVTQAPYFCPDCLDPAIQSDIRQNVSRGID